MNASEAKNIAKQAMLDPKACYQTELDRVLVKIRKAAEIGDSQLTVYLSSPVEDALSKLGYSVYMLEKSKSKDGRTRREINWY